MFLRKFLSFLLILWVLDLSLGWILRNMYFCQTSGKYYRITNTIENTIADLVVFGSSTAAHHYVSETLSKYTKLDSYNSGVQGQGILFISALQEMMLKRHVPKMIVLNIDLNCLYKRKEMYDRLSALYPYYRQYKNQLIKFVRLRNKMEEYKLISNLYPFNSTFVHLIKYMILPQKDFNGY